MAVRWESPDSGIFYGLRRAEIPDEAVQRIVTWKVLAVMVPRHGKNRAMIEFVWLIKLLIVFLDLSIKIHAVTRDVEKCRVLAGVGVGIEIRLHPFGNELLGDSI